MERLGDETRTLARHDRENLLGFQRAQTLDLAHDLAHFLRGHRDILGDGENFHKNYLASAFAVWRRVS